MPVAPPWLFRIAHNEAVSRLRRRRDVVELDLVETLATDSTAQEIENRERLAQLRADLQDLPERQRAALVMRELSGLGHAEIAAVLGGSPQTVQQTIFQARAALHACAEGREMLCAEVQRLLSDGDGRVLRGRRMRAHVRACRSCREFEAALAERPVDLAALAPAPPAAVGATWLSALLAAGAGSHAAGVAGTLATKALVITIAAATVAGATTAVRDVTHEAAPPPARVSRARPAAAALPSTRHAVTRAAQPLLPEPPHRRTGGQSGHHATPVVRVRATTKAFAKPVDAGPPSTGAGAATESAPGSPDPAQPSSVQSPAKAQSPAKP